MGLLQLGVLMAASGVGSLAGMPLSFPLPFSILFFIAGVAARQNRHRCPPVPSTSTHTTNFCLSCRLEILLPAQLSRK